MVHLTLLYEGAVPDGMTQREFGVILKDAYETIGVHWHKHFRPKHFTAAGALEYKYTPRSGEQPGISRKRFWRSYTGRKLRRLGHRKPLVYSGLSEKLTEMRDVRATPRGVRIVLHATGLNRRNPHTQINKVEELRTVSDAEQTELMRIFDRYVEGRLRYGARPPRRIAVQY